MKEFSFLVGNCPGALVEIAEALGNDHVNIEGIGGLTVLEEGVIGHGWLAAPVLPGIAATVAALVWLVALRDR